MKKSISEPNQANVFNCHGRDLRNCPYKGIAVYETKSDRTWKNGVVWIFICQKCADDLLKDLAA